MDAHMEDGAPAPPAADLQQQLTALDLVPLWKVYASVVTAEPASDVPSHLWRWQDLAPVVAMTERAVTGPDADHRVLVLKNPKAARFGSVTNIVVAVQCVLPGEATAPHRHTPAAVRVVLEANGAATLVDGQVCRMQPGDFVVTPNWAWHSHRNDSAERAVWVDFLDVPLAKSLNNVFGEGGPPPHYPQHAGTLPHASHASGGVVPISDLPAAPVTPRVLYPWAEIDRVLGTVPPLADGSRGVRYVNPADGGAVLPTLDASALRLDQGRPTQRRRTSASTVCVVVSGAGRSRIGGVEHEWSARDIFTIPEWAWVEHEASSATANLILVSDAEVRRRLSFLREERA